MSDVIEVSVNGSARVFAAALTVAGLLEQLGLNPKLVAVEVNREVIPREVHASHPLRCGDKVEVVTFVGGG